MSAFDSTWGWLLDLERNVRRKLAQRYGGTGNEYGYATGVVRPFSNGEGATLALGTLVQLKASYDDSRVVKSAAADSALVVGVVVGSYVDDDGLTFQAVAPPDNQLAAVMIAGVTTVVIGSAVTRGQYAYSSSTAGAAKSSATLGPGAFGIFMVSASSGSAKVVLSALAGGGGAGVSYGTPALTLGTSNAAGAASTGIRTDATILAFDATTPAASPLGGSGSVGAAAVAARRDHVHAVAGDLGDLDDVLIGTPDAFDVLTYDGVDWVPFSPADFTSIWRPVMDGAVPGTVIVDSGTGEAIMAYGPA